ncbi:hypothetical protein [Rhizobium leguminosarum]|uniref:hypothetical protein n=1 Tax=Rhizobium leguminosarum TaxID=384 RepID=UPI001FDEC928|nr:hypothetical protein [Rhizobium leguminosarum]
MKEAKEPAERHAGILVVKRERRPAVGEEGDPTIVFQSGRIGRAAAGLLRLVVARNCTALVTA